MLSGCGEPVRLFEPPLPLPAPSNGQLSSVELDFRVAEDLRTVTGHERIAFTPDLEVCELKFRAWPNAPIPASAGSSLTLTAANVDGWPVAPRFEAGGATDGVQGTIITLPLTSCVQPGDTVIAELAFELALGADADDRLGTASAGDLAWFGSAYPMLAWERGRGWALQDAVAVVGESTVSETFELVALRVDAPSRFDVLGVGTAHTPLVDAAEGRTVHEFTAHAIRDVTVTVGSLQRAQAMSESGTVIHVGGPRGRLDAPSQVWAREVADAVDRVSAYLGDAPFSEIWVSLVPEQTDGIEYPGAIQFGRFSPDEDRWLITHEVAHMWFYALVGNNQALHPWLDEAFASFVQLVVDHPQREQRFARPGCDLDRLDSCARGGGHVGWSMEQWSASNRASDRYVEWVYVGGANMLLLARERAGSDAFDTVLREYVRENAHRIATPETVRAAFSDLPESLKVFEAFGALDEADDGQGHCSTTAY